MPTVNIDVDSNLSTLVYNAGDDLVIRYGAVLTMDSHTTKNPLSVQCITNGTFQITNSSATTPIGLALNSNAGDLRFEKNGKIIARGAMIELTAGSGSPSQVWDFSGSPLNRIIYPTYVEVETAVGSGIYEPWMIVCTAGKTVTFSPSIFSSNECGKVVFWNASTSILSVGDGTNGNYLASGQKIRIPNIVIHGAVQATNVLNRSQLDLNPAGYADFECVNFTNSIYLQANSMKYLRFYRVGGCTTINFGNTNGSGVFDHVSLTPDTEQSATSFGFQLTSFLGALTVDYLTILGTGTAWSGTNNQQIINNLSLTSISHSKFIMPRDRDTTGNRVMHISQNFALANISDCVCIGTRLNIDATSNCKVINLKHADRLNTTSTTSIPTYVFYFSACQNIKIINLSNAGIAAPRTGIIFIDAFCSNINMYNLTYDCNSNTIAIPSAWVGSILGIYNCNFTNMAPNSGPTMDSPATFLCDYLIARNVRATWTGTRSNEATPYGIEDLIPGLPANYLIAYSMAYGHNSSSLVDSGLTAATGSIVFAAFGEWTGYNTLTGTAQYDWTGLVELPANNDAAEFISQTYHAISDFQNLNPVWTYYEGGVQRTAYDTPPSTMTVQFAIRNPAGAWTSLQTLNAANLAAAVSGLSGYDSDVGLQIKLVVTGVGADATRNFGAVWWFTDIDNTWVASGASITIDGAAMTDIVRLKKNSDDSIIATFVGSGSFEFYIGLNYGIAAYLTRSTTADVLVCSTKYDTFILDFGDNGTHPLFSGDEIQLAHAEQMSAVIDEIKAIDINIYDDLVVLQSDVDAMQIDVSAIESDVGTMVVDVADIETNLSAVGLNAVDILKLTGYKVTRTGNIITIYQVDGTTPWRSYDLSNGGRVQL